MYKYKFGSVTPVPESLMGNRACAHCASDRLLPMITPRQYWMILLARWKAAWNKWQATACRRWVTLQASRH